VTRCYTDSRKDPEDDKDIYHEGSIACSLRRRTAPLIERRSKVSDIVAVVGSEFQQVDVSTLPTSTWDEHTFTNLVKIEVISSQLLYFHPTFSASTSHGPCSFQTTRPWITTLGVIWLPSMSPHFYLSYHGGMSTSWEVPSPLFRWRSILWTSGIFPKLSATSITYLGNDMAVFWYLKKSTLELTTAAHPLVEANECGRRRAYERLGL